jgi:hypothetical protein
MPCVMCASENQAEFPAEVNIHFPGLQNLDKTSVLVFPILLVCLDCGCSRLLVPEPRLALLRNQSNIAPSVTIDQVLRRRTTISVRK